MNTYQTLALAVLLGSIPVRRIFESRRTRDAENELSDVELTAIGVLNAVKIAVPVFLAARFLNPKIALVACVIGVLSSCFPYWLMFKPQGKGFAELLGGLVGLNPIAGVCALAVWAGVLLVSDRFSLAAMAAAVCAPILLRLFNAPMAYIGLAIFACAYAIIAHSPNIPKLIDGTEPHWKRNE